MKTITNQPITWIYLATIPLIAFTTSLEIGFYSAVVLLVVVLLTKLIQKGLNKYITSEFKPYLYLLIIALQISVIQLISKTYISFYNNEIGIYLSLMMVNIVLVLPEKEKTDIKKMVINLGYSTALLLFVGLFREAIGTAHIKINSLNINVSLFNSDFAITFLQTVPGGLLIAGTILAIYGWVINMKKEEPNKEEKSLWF